MNASRLDGLKRVEIDAVTRAIPRRFQPGIACVPQFSVRQSHGSGCLEAPTITAANVAVADWFRSIETSSHFNTDDANIVFKLRALSKVTNVGNHTFNDLMRGQVASLANGFE